MRKQKVELNGTLSFLDDSGMVNEIKIQNLGSYLKPSYGGLMDGSLVNDRLFIIELQGQGFKISHTFHYEKHSEMVQKRQKYINICKNVIVNTIKDNYQRVPVDMNLFLDELYDVDYCQLSLSEMEADLTPEEMQKVLAQSQHYQSTTRTQRKQSVFFG